MIEGEVPEEVVVVNFVKTMAASLQDVSKANVKIVNLREVMRMSRQNPG